MMLKGRNALVTGSTSGIGLSIAVALAESGANVMLNGFGDPPGIESLRRELSERTGTIITYSPADMRDPAAIAEMIGLTQAAFGSLDILVNNAGIQHVAPIEQFPVDKWADILAINLSSNFHTIRAALPEMKKRGWGRIVNIASAHGLVASPFKSAYVAAKHGVLGLTKTVALEASETAVTCNAICPGYVRTELVEKQIADQAKVHGLPEDQVIRNIILASQPNRRFIQLEEISALVVFLCSPAAVSITGTSISVDGGFTAR